MVMNMSQKNEKTIDDKVLDEWARDVIKWTIDELENGNINAVIDKMEDVVMAVVVTVRPKYRNQIIKLIKVLFKVFERR